MLRGDYLVSYLIRCCVNPVYYEPTMIDMNTNRPRQLIGRGPAGCSRRLAAWFACVLSAAATIGAPAARACNVPVFRYALERWPADAYRVVIFRRGPLSGADRKTVQKLVKSSWDAEEDSSAQPAQPAAGAATTPKTPVANYFVIEVDLAGKKVHERAKEMWKAQKTQTLPWMVVQYPLRRPGGARTLWAGALDAKVADNLADSPKRREIARKLLAGDTAVWVLLESGKAKADKAAEKVLTKQFKEIQDAMQKPFEELVGAGSDPTDPDSANDPEVNPNLKLRFSLIRVSKKDPAERMFVKMLMRSEEDLESEYASSVMAFPIFGRGRALFALVGKGINAGNIQEACVFLLGACSCRVKAMNPGTDLVMAVDWQANLMKEYVRDVEVPALPGPIGSVLTTQPAGGATTRPAPAGAGATTKPAKPAQPKTDR